ncbi:hypothetical protein PILCRDRAFT_8500 [Piloderma croceum F 1598]|uniref:Fe2OG dioxygenase domain-containing protein n=1 Tax=Piloderma croceum (strain F 1598) TaxID=765440 RepID=A0A0C3FRQ8_PILCF|nr:hypothetical protein PILCRDRAFT_8500 [Piloderma croceum F 1598]
MPAITEKLHRFFGGSPVVNLETPLYLPPPGPPPDRIDEKRIYTAPGPPFGSPKHVDFPFLSSEQVITLYNQGFARVCLPPDHPLHDAATALFSTSREFFAKDLHEKEQFHRSNLPSSPCEDGSKGKGQSSEEGWSRVEGEKEMFTFRRNSTCPSDEVVKNARSNVQQLWRECGNFMQEMMQPIETSLELRRGAFGNVVNQECALPADEIHETLLRMFRYERASETRIVSAKHRDIGLLSLVIGSSPGLEVWDNTITRRDPITGVVSDGDWVAIENDDNATQSQGGLTFTFLIGETLTALTNDLYQPGIHRVSVPPADPSSATDESKYRYSLVFALRPYRQATVYTPSLTTAVTGEFKWPRKDDKGVIKTVRSVDLFTRIANMHWSVNDQVAEREAKRMRLEQEREARAQRVLIQS